MTSLVVGEKIFSEGDFSFPFYIIVASDETAETAGVEVLKDAGGSERLMTRLHRGMTSTSTVCVNLVCKTVCTLSKRTARIGILTECSIKW